MKKLVLMAVAMVAISFASCGNKAANAEQATEATATETAAPADSTAAVADSTATDSAAVATPAAE